MKSKVYALNKYGFDAINEYRNMGFFSCHRDSYDLSGQRLRHHAINLDIGAIIDTDRFSGKLNLYVRNLNPIPKMILNPPHKKGLALGNAIASHVKSVHDINCSVHSVSDLYNFNDLNLIKFLKNATEDDSIIVADDVSITWQRLHAYQRDLRRLQFIGKIHYLVGVARPESYSEWEKRVKYLSYRDGYSESYWHTVVPLEKMILPDINEKECSWCHEEKFLSRLALNSYTVPEFLQKRLRALQNTGFNTKPLIDDLFLEFNDNNAFHITENSVFIQHPASQTDVVAGISHKLAMMRNDPDSPLKSFGYPARSVLSKECYLGNCFNDSIIRAVILRMCHNDEIEYSTHAGEEERRQLVNRILSSDDPEVYNLYLEVLLGLAFRKLPHLVLQDNDKKN